jgi:signal transduction histidine kinase/ActR/RegA family two-component response regulator
MGPPGTTSWILVSASVLLLATGSDPRRRTVAWLAALAASLISSLSVVGYLYAASRLYTIPTLTVIAFQTATFVLSVSVGLLLSVPERDPMRRLADTGVAGSLARPILPVLVVVPIVLGYLRLEGERRGLYDTSFGVALTIFTLIVMVVAVLLWSLGKVATREEALTKSETSLVAANKAKDEFLAMLGHELRNPLAPIMSAVDMMRLRGEAPREREVIGRQVAHLKVLLDDLLDVSRVVRGSLELRTKPMQLDEAVRRGVEMANPLLERRAQKVQLEVPSVGLPIDGDRERLAQVVYNLLANASKYSEPGAVIRVRAERAGESVRLVVRDEGVGIAPDFLGRIFEPFFQPPQALDRAEGGLGLGLAIVRSVVELHRGTVAASSGGVGEGSTFVVELPIHLGAEAPAASSPERTNAPAVENAARDDRILVIDDNVDAARMLAEYLTELGYRVETAHDGPSAVVLAETWRPHVCLIDIGLPGMDGYELARRLRSSGHIDPGARLIAVTGYGRDGDRRQSAQAGFDVHLVKPVTLDVLTSALSSQGVEGRRPRP